LNSVARLDYQKTFITSLLPYQTGVLGRAGMFRQLVAIGFRVLVQIARRKLGRVGTARLKLSRLGVGQLSISADGGELRGFELATLPVN
jgi:hypothetical protein